MQCESEDAEDKRRRECEERERAKVAEEMESTRLAQERNRKALVTAFLKEHGYNNVTTPKRTMLKTKYPIHSAAKTGDPEIVAALLAEGAIPAQKDSSGHTAAQVARSKNKRGSHDSVLQTLSEM